PGAHGPARGSWGLVGWATPARAPTDQRTRPWATSPGNGFDIHSQEGGDWVHAPLPRTAPPRPDRLRRPRLRRARPVMLPRRRRQVRAAFYPPQYVVGQVGGEHVAVSSLTPPAAEPHDLELAPAQVRRIGDADLVVYLSGFQPAVDEGIEQRAPEHVVDAAES